MLLGEESLTSCHFTETHPQLLVYVHVRCVLSSSKSCYSQLPKPCLQDMAGTDFVIHPTEFDMAFTSFEEDTSANGTEF